LIDAELSRKNIRWGLALLAVALVLFAGAIIAAEIYNVVAS
jgi:hypothetical protein